MIVQHNEEHCILRGSDALPDPKQRYHDGMWRNHALLGYAVAVALCVAPQSLIAQSSLVTLATYFGGSGPDQLVAVREGSDASIVIAGNTSSPDIPTTKGAF